MPQSYPAGVSKGVHCMHRFLTVYDRHGDDDGEGTLQPEWEINRKDLVLLNKVGDGEYGTVYRAKWLGSSVAVKVLKGSDAVGLGDLRWAFSHSSPSTV